MHHEFGQPIGRHSCIVVDESDEIERSEKFTAAALGTSNTQIAPSGKSEVSHRFENPHMRKLVTYLPDHVVQGAIVDKHDLETI
jgi:uncharacterized Zn-finger protein